MFCPNCGLLTAPGASACEGCGWQVGQQPTMDHDPGMRMLLPVGRSGYAIAAGYLGLVSPMMCTAPFAILFGVLALLDIKKKPHLGGSGRAIFGIVMGSLFTLLPIVVFAVSAITHK